MWIGLGKPPGGTWASGTSVMERRRAPNACGRAGPPSVMAMRSNCAFKERFGSGPKADLQRRRLLRVRAELIKPGSPLTISHVANGSGFWHMGQLARDYRRLFGELPSETLNRR